MNTTTTEDSFISAWSKAQFPGENRTFVKSFCDEIGIAAFEYKPRAPKRAPNVPHAALKSAKTAQN